MSIDPRLLLPPGEDTEPRGRIGDPIPGQPEPEGYGQAYVLVSNLTLALKSRRQAQIQRLCTELEKHGDDPLDVLSKAYTKALAKAKRKPGARVRRVDPRIKWEELAQSAIAIGIHGSIVAMRKSLRETGSPSLENSPAWLATRGSELIAIATGVEFETEPLAIFWRALPTVVIKARSKHPDAWKVLEETGWAVIGTDNPRGDEARNRTKKECRTYASRFRKLLKKWGTDPR